MKPVPAQSVMSHAKRVLAANGRNHVKPVLAQNLMNRVSDPCSKVIRSPRTARGQFHQPKLGIRPADDHALCRVQLGRRLADSYWPRLLAGVAHSTARNCIAAINKMCLAVGVNPNCESSSDIRMLAPGRSVQMDSGHC